MQHKNQCGAYIKHISDVLQRNCNNVPQLKGCALPAEFIASAGRYSPNGEKSLKEPEKQLQGAQSTADRAYCLSDSVYTENSPRPELSDLDRAGGGCAFSYVGNSALYSCLSQDSSQLKRVNIFLLY